MEKVDIYFAWDKAAAENREYEYNNGFAQILISAKGEDVPTKYIAKVRMAEISEEFSEISKGKVISKIKELYPDFSTKFAFRKVLKRRGTAPGKGGPKKYGKEKTDPLRLPISLHKMFQDQALALSTGHADHLSDQLKLTSIIIAVERIKQAGHVVCFSHISSETGDIVIEFESLNGKKNGKKKKALVNVPLRVNEYKLDGIGLSKKSSTWEKILGKLVLIYNDPVDWEKQVEEIGLIIKESLWGFEET